MSDKELGDALLKLDLAAGAVSADPNVQRVIDHDRQRVKRLTRAVVGLWILAAVGALLLFVIGGFVFPLIAQAREAQARNVAPSDAAFLMLAKLTAVTIILVLLSFGALVAAGLATVVLVFRSRRATLRQINANLLQISEQLKQLQQPRGT